MLVVQITKKNKLKKKEWTGQLCQLQSVGVGKELGLSRVETFSPGGCD